MKIESVLLFTYIGLFCFFGGAHATSSRWETSCMKYPSFSKKYRIEFKTDGHLHYTEKNFGDTDCKKKRSDFRVHTVYTSPATQEKNTLTKIDYIIKGLFFTPADQNSASILIGEKFCGLTQWVSNTPMDISRSFCQIHFPTPGEMIYYSYSIQENNLFIGKMTPVLNGTKPELRPKELLYEMPFFPEDSPTL